MINGPIIALLLCLAAFAGGGYFGYDYAQKQYAEEELARKSGWADALEASAKELAKLKVTNTTRNITLEREITKEVQYRDCKHTPEAMKQLNDALKGGAK